MLRWLICEPGDTIDHVVTYWPSRGPHGIEWPTYRGYVGGMWVTASPVWDRVRVRCLVQRIFR